MQIIHLASFQQFPSFYLLLVAKLISPVILEDEKSHQFSLFKKPFKMYCVYFSLYKAHRNCEIITCVLNLSKPYLVINEITPRTNSLVQ